LRVRRVSGTSKKDQIGFFDLYQYITSKNRKYGPLRHLFLNWRVRFAGYLPTQAFNGKFDPPNLTNMQPLVAATSAISAAAAAATFPGVVAILAINGPVAAGLKWNGGLLPATGTCDRRGL